MAKHSSSDIHDYLTEKCKVAQVIIMYTSVLFHPFMNVYMSCSKLKKRKKERRLQQYNIDYCTRIRCTVILYAIVVVIVIFKQLGGAKWHRARACD